MALSWTMDKIGTICRAVEDCALVLTAIYRQDGHDLSVQPAAFNWDANLNWKTPREWYIKSSFDSPTLPAVAAEGQKRNFDRLFVESSDTYPTASVFRQSGRNLT